jgi:hypothetical protein
MISGSYDILLSLNLPSQCRYQQASQRKQKGEVPLVPRTLKSIGIKNGWVCSCSTPIKTSTILRTLATVTVLSNTWCIQTSRRGRYNKKKEINPLIEIAIAIQINIEHGTMRITRDKLLCYFIQSEMSVTE